MRTIDDRALAGELSGRIGGKKTVICGVGNEMRGDDAVGIRAAEFLASSELRGGVSVLICGELPENYLQEIVGFDPECVVMLDAANVGLPPGSIVMIENDEISAQALSTHRLPLSFLSKVIASRLDHGFDIFVLGIQIGSYGFGEEMTPDVVRSSEIVSSSLASVLSP